MAASPISWHPAPDRSPTTSAPTSDGGSLWLDGQQLIVDGNRERAGQRGSAVERKDRLGFDPRRNESLEIAVRVNGGGIVGDLLAPGRLQREIPHHLQSLRI